MFERAKPRGQISARELREAGRVLESVPARAAEGSDAFPLQTPGGTAWLTDAADMFLAEVTVVNVVSLLSPVQYGYREVWPDPGTGQTGPKTSGRQSDGTMNYGLALPGRDFDVGDVVVARRHPRDPHLFLFLFAVAAGERGSSGAGDSFSFIVHRNPRCENGLLVYDEVTVRLHGNVWGEEV